MHTSYPKVTVQRHGWLDVLHCHIFDNNMVITCNNVIRPTAFTATFAGICEPIEAEHCQNRKYNHSVIQTQREWMMDACKDDQFNCPAINQPGGNVFSFFFLYNLLICLSSLINIRNTNTDYPESKLTQ